MFYAEYVIYILLISNNKLQLFDFLFFNTDGITIEYHLPITSCKVLQKTVSSYSDNKK